MRLSVTCYGKTYTIESELDDMDGFEMGELFQQLMLAMGYQSGTVREVFGYEEEVDPIPDSEADE